MDDERLDHPAPSSEAQAAARRRRLDLGALDTLFGFHVRMAQASIYRDFAASLAELAITQKQFAVLALVEANPGASQVDLAAALGTDRATMMALVDRLDGRGWIERRTATGDRRRQELHLTNEGEAAYARTLALVRGHEARLLDGVASSQRDACVALLRRLSSGLAG